MIRRLHLIRYKILLITLFALSVCVTTWTCSSNGVDQFSHYPDPRSFSKDFSSHDLWPLMETTWQVTSFLPDPPKPFKSMLYNFKSDGTLRIVITNMDGKHEVTNQGYRILRSTLFIKRPDGDVTDYKFKVDRNTLTLENKALTIVIVMKRV